MNRFRVWGLSAALAVGVGSPIFADQPLPGEQTTLLNKLFGPRPPKPAGPTVSNRPITITAPLPPEVVKEALRAEQDAYLRRVSVCNELQRIGLERGDESLVRQAAELERQSAALYNARVASLGVTRTKAPLPEPTMPYTALAAPPGDPGSVKMAANKLVAPVAPVPAGSTAQAREVKP